jgi:hypothetical protein
VKFGVSLEAKNLFTSSATTAPHVGLFVKLIKLPEQISNLFCFRTERETLT